MNIIGFAVSCEIDYGKYLGHKLVINYTANNCGLYIDNVPLITYEVGNSINIKLDISIESVVADLMHDLYNKSKTENGCIDIKEIAKIAKKVYSILLPRTCNDDYIVIKRY